MKNKFKEGNIVSYDSILENGHRITYTCVLLMVTQENISNGINSDKQGLHLFTGYWYVLANENHLDHVHYGKIHGHICNFLRKRKNNTAIKLVHESVMSINFNELNSLLGRP